MVSLSFNDLDLDGRRIRVVGKGNKIGIVPFSARTAKVLWAYLMQRKVRAKTDRLWITADEDITSGQEYLINAERLYEAR